MTSQSGAIYTPLVGGNVFVHNHPLFFVVAVDGISMVTVARGDRCVLERNVKGTVDGFEGTVVDVVGYADLGRVAAKLLNAVVCLFKHTTTVTTMFVMILMFIHLNSRQSDWLVEYGLTSHLTHYRSFRRRWG